MHRPIDAFIKRILKIRKSGCCCLVFTGTLWRKEFLAELRKLMMMMKVIMIVTSILNIVIRWF